MMLVLSAPVAGGVPTVRLTSTKRVTAFGLSPMFVARTSRSWWAVIPGGAIAASATPLPAPEGSKRLAAAATFDDDGMCPWLGRFSSSQRWHWA
jgi:hypothetical protein